MFVDELAVTLPGFLRNMTSTDRNSSQQLTQSYSSCECEYVFVYVLYTCVDAVSLCVL